MKKQLKEPLISLAWFFLRILLPQSYREFLLSTWCVPEKRNWFDNKIYPILVYCWFAREFYTEPDPDLRVCKQKLLMGGDSGVNWANIYYTRPFPHSKDERCGELSFSEACPIFERIYLACKNAPDDTYFFQIGSSSGREIAWLAKDFPKIHFFGTDLYPAVVDFCNTKFKFSNLKFFAMSAKDIHQALEVLDNKNIILFSSGSLQYVQPEHLDYFFKYSLKNNNKIEIHAHESCREKHGEVLDMKGSLPDGNFTYSHNYAHYARKNGWNVLTSKIIRPYVPYDKYPGYLFRVHYDFVCTNKESSKADLARPQNMNSLEASVI